MALVTVAEVKAATGVELKSSAIAMAQNVIEMTVNRTEAASGDMGARDLRNLKLAVMYQAAYMDSHPDLMSLMDVNSVGQGGLNVGFKSAEHTLIAPLARMAIRKLSWVRNRSLQVNTDFQRSTVDYDESMLAIDEEDDALNWEAI